MLDRLNDLASTESEDHSEDNTAKFINDMEQLIDGMLDLKRRGQLPDRERTVAMKLLLRITLKENYFDGTFLQTAASWLTIMEGTRRRGPKAAAQDTPNRKQGGGRGSQQRQRGGRGGASNASRNIDYEDDDEDLVSDAEEDKNSDGKI